MIPNDTYSFNQTKKQSSEGNPTPVSFRPSEARGGIFFLPVLPYPTEGNPSVVILNEVKDLISNTNPTHIKAS